MLDMSIEDDGVSRSTASADGPSGSIFRTPMAPRFSGLSAFPLTPMRDDAVDEEAFAGIVERLAASGVDSIGALGSTGSYAYLSRAERARVARLAVEHAAGVPVIVGVGALRTSQVLALVDDAEATGLNAGCETWYSVVGGTLPEVALAIVRAAQAGRGDDAQALADRLPPLWELFEDHGSLRVVAAVAERLGFAPDGCLPLPLRGLTADERERVTAVVARLGLAG